MLSRILQTLLVAVITLSATSCAAVEGIFKAGVGVGIGMVILVLVLIAVVWGLMRGGGGSAAT
jgi:hypothetical protein